MKYKPHNYQDYATDFVLSHDISALFLDCGLGKTVITLTALWDLILDDFEVGRVLIIAPLRVARDTWSEELCKWEHLSGLTLSVVVGSEKERLAALKVRANIYVINRENVVWLCEKYKWDFDMIVIDELSSFKSHQAKRFKVLRKYRPKARRVLGLTGTPGNLMDLWAEIGILDMGERLGRYIGGFRDRYFLPDKRNRNIIYSYKPRDGAEDAIYSKIGDICISMKAEDYLDMPDCFYHKIEVKMNAKEEKLYRQMERDMLLPFADGDVDAVNAGALGNKLLQMANGAVYDENGKVRHIHDRKLEALEDLIEAANGQSVLIAYWFKHDLQRIQERFDVTPLDKASDIKKWKAGKIELATIHPASAGHGLNLQSGGHILIWLGLTWSLELYQQCIDRLWRQGQEHPVMIYHLVNKGTIDEDAIASLDEKDCGQSAIMNAVKARIGGVTLEGRKDD
jgi:Superfamily II DNA/RNA helicases, SNF2 family